mmetsp:Transcript_84551/g.262559  ORF Transcript_84551/g.262559 Transcript_84551/m.262559 type:complete len:348 (-) Transcript_84551:437-1480(-)
MHACTHASASERGGIAPLRPVLLLFPSDDEDVQEGISDPGADEQSAGEEVTHAAQPTRHAAAGEDVVGPDPRAYGGANRLEEGLGGKELAVVILVRNPSAVEGRLCRQDDAPAEAREHPARPEEYLGGLPEDRAQAREEQADHRDAHAKEPRDEGAEVREEPRGDGRATDDGRGIEHARQGGHRLRQAQHRELEAPGDVHRAHGGHAHHGAQQQAVEQKGVPCDQPEGRDDLGHGLPHEAFAFPAARAQGVAVSGLLPAFLAGRGLPLLPAHHGLALPGVAAQRLAQQEAGGDDREDADARHDAPDLLVLRELQGQDVEAGDVGRKDAHVQDDVVRRVANAPLGRVA